MLIGRVWVHLVYSPLEWKSGEKASLITAIKVCGEALKLLSSNHKSDSREGKKKDEKTSHHTELSDGVSDSHRASRDGGRKPPAGFRIY